MKLLEILTILSVSALTLLLAVYLLGLSAGAG
jgi:hypothetical protein